MLLHFAHRLGWQRDYIEQNAQQYHARAGIPRRKEETAALLEISTVKSDYRSS